MATGRGAKLWIWFGFVGVLGITVLGALLYRAPIGLDASAFPAGEWIQSVMLRFLPQLQNAIAAWVLFLGALLGLGLAGFFVGRTPKPDAGRRSFLQAASGTGVALGSVVLAGGLAAARGFLGWGEGGRGWSGVAEHISDGDIAFKHPE